MINAVGGQFYRRPIRKNKRTRTKTNYSQADRSDKEHRVAVILRESGGKLSQLENGIITKYLHYKLTLCEFAMLILNFISLYLSVLYVFLRLIWP